jgi:hypothetical protein
VAQLLPRDKVIAAADEVLLPKPTLEDLTSLRDGQVLWGWAHAAQDPKLTQAYIDKQLTLIAWEAMNRWTPAGGFLVRVFHLNNELAGYAPCCTPRRWSAPPVTTAASSAPRSSASATQLAAR